MLGRSSKVVLTDSNLRAESVPNRLTEDRGPVLAADETTARMAGIWTADDQSVRLQRGWGATATSEGSAFRPLPWGAAENAVDDDPRTAWYAGDFGTATGSELTVDVGAASSGELVVHATSPGDAQISAMVLRVGGVESDLTRTAEGSFVGTLPPGTTEFTVRVTGVAPSGSLANVGISEVTLDGRASPVADVLRTPLTLTTLLASLPAEERGQVVSRPLDVVLSRRLGAAVSPVVEEPSLDRVVELPWDDSFSFRGAFRLGTPMPETELDLMEGAAGDIRATSSSQAFGLPTGRASMALDGDEGTGWLPAEPAVGEQWRASFADPVSAKEITVVQPTTGRQLTEVVLRVDGDEDVRARLAPGRTVIALPRRTDVSDVAITVTGVSEPATEPARLLEVELGDARVDRSGAEPGCLTVARVDGEPVTVRPAAPVTGSSFLASSCGPARRLAAGPHEWTSVREFTSDLVVWSDGASSTEPPSRSSVVDLGNDSDQAGRPPSPGWTGELPERSEDVVVVAGVGYDPAWRLTVDGTDLGPPVLVNGYAAGWVVTAGERATLALSYGPQQAALVGLAISGVTLLFAAGVVATRRRAMAADVREREPWARALEPPAQGRARQPGPPRVAPARGRWRAALTVAGWLLLGGVVLGVPGLVAAAVGLGLRRVRQRVAAVVLTAGWAVVTVAWFVGASELLGAVTPELVAATSVAHACAGGVVVASVVWVLGRGGGGP